jgi:DNA-binding Lrp family transcriptional regulator
MDKLLKLLDENAKYSNEELALILGTTPEAVASAIEKYESEGVIKGFKAVINWEKAEAKEFVTALIEIKVTPRKSTGFDEIARDIMSFDEVESVYLMSGGFDLCAIVNGRTFREVALFVSQRLATLDSVLSTATHFVLSRYKDNGVILCDEPVDERGSVL